MHEFQLLSDGYKLSHHKMYPKGTTLVFSNITNRSSKYAPKFASSNGIIVMGIRKALTDLKELLDKWFAAEFDESIKELFDNYLQTDYSVDHFRALHKLGYMPVSIRAMKEGSFCPTGVPFATIHNTLDEFYWVTNFLETYLSANLWKASTSASIAAGYYNIAKRYFEETTENTPFGFNFHNFSARGMDSVDAMVAADLGHLLFFNGSDTLPTMFYLKKLYGVKDHMGNVPASEHSVMSAGTKENELQTYSDLLDIFPKGFLSLVSDTWDLWNVLQVIMVKLKSKILERDGRLVIRPDSGNPVLIICGDPNAPEGTPQRKGAIQLLWEVFGGTVNSKGYKLLNPKVGLIYGDSITLERADLIFSGLKANGFASSNVVLGIGSYTYQYNTRDTYGMAVKATYVERDGVGFNITKDPVTDDGTKKSATGLLSVVEYPGAHGMSNPVLIQESTWEQVRSELNLLKEVFLDGNLTFDDTWVEITTRAKNNVQRLTF